MQAPTDFAEPSAAAAATSRRSGRIWNVKGLPHKGWTCLAVHTRNRHDYPDGECEMCHNESLIHYHEMEHPAVAGTILVGCVCAARMEGEVGANPTAEEVAGSRAARRQREAEGRLSRRDTFISSPRWRISRKGHPRIRHRDGFMVVLVRSRHGHYRPLVIREACGSKWQSHSWYGDRDKAAGAAFDFCESVHSHPTLPRGFEQVG